MIEDTIKENVNLIILQPPAGKKFNIEYYPNSHLKDGSTIIRSHGCSEKTGSYSHWHYDTMNQNSEKL